MQKLLSSEFFLRICTGFILICLLMFILHASHGVFMGAMLICLAEILVYEWPHIISPKKKLLGLIYPTIPFLLLITLDLQNRQYVWLIFLTAAAHDIGSYITGKLWGNHKIAPHISPGKTWEGFAGGYLVTVITVSYLLKVSWPWVLILSMLLSISALLGDLFESYLKRKAGKKDAGHLLPGHGGLLDRFDSILGITLMVFFLSRAL